MESNLTLAQFRLFVIRLSGIMMGQAGRCEMNGVHVAAQVLHGISTALFETSKELDEEDWKFDENS